MKNDKRYPFAEQLVVVDSTCSINKLERLDNPVFLSEMLSELSVLIDSDACSEDTDKMFKKIAILNVKHILLLVDRVNQLIDIFNKQ